MAHIRMLTTTKRIIEKKFTLAERTMRNMQNKIEVVSKANKDYRAQNGFLKHRVKSLATSALCLVNHSKFIDQHKSKCLSYLDKENYDKL